MPVVRAASVSKRIADRTILEDVVLTLDEGQALLIRGRSGSGKSTLLHIIAGLDEPTSGRMELAGHDLSALDADGRARLRLAKVGMVFQHFNLIPDLTAEENVRLPLTLARHASPRIRALELLRQLDLADRARAFPGSLSGGEMQRVAIARALANDPSLVLADEPTANLDEQNAVVVLELLRSIASQGRAVIVASHDPLALERFPLRAELRSGRLVHAPLPEPPSNSQAGTRLR